MKIEDLYINLLEDAGALCFEGLLCVGDYKINLSEANAIEAIIKEWFAQWTTRKGLNVTRNLKDSFPDFFLNPDDKKKDLMEIKAFNYKAAPGFDIADFRMYEQEIAQKPWMLDVTYLIFGYDMSDDGIVTIKRVWKQKVWEITRPMISGRTTPWPLCLQIKKGVVSKMRPAKWFTTSNRFRTFENVEDFLSAVEETVYQNVDTRSDGPSWKHKMLQAYKDYFGVSLSIPRWSDIQDKYILPKG